MQSRRLSCFHFTLSLYEQLLGHEVEKCCITITFFRNCYWQCISHRPVGFLHAATAKATYVSIFHGLHFHLVLDCFGHFERWCIRDLLHLLLWNDVYATVPRFAMRPSRWNLQDLQRCTFHSWYRLLAAKTCLVRSKKLTCSKHFGRHRKDECKRKTLLYCNLKAAV